MASTHGISGTSLLMVVADHDNIAVTDVPLALAPKRLVMIKGGHSIPISEHPSVPISPHQALRHDPISRKENACLSWNGSY
jgi:hypothetical protein